MNNYVISDTDLLIYRSSSKNMMYTSIDDYKYVPGDKVLSVDKNEEITYCSITDKVNKQTSKNFFLVEITLESGRKTYRVADDNCFTIDPCGNLQQTSMNNLYKGCSIPRHKNLKISNTNNKVIIPEGKTDNSYRQRTLNRDFNLGWVVGLYLSEGYVCCRKSTSIHFGGLDDHIQQKVINYFDDIGVHAKENTTGILVGWTKFGEFLSDCYGNGSFYKFVGNDAFNSPTQFREGVLAGYLAGDGCVTQVKNRVRVLSATRSRDLCYSLNLLCTSLNIDTTIEEKIKNEKPIYVLRIRCPDITKLPKLYHPKKDHRLKTYEPWSGKRGFDIIPSYKSLHKLLLKNCDDGSSTLRHSYRNRLSREELKYTLSSKACPWIEANIIWDKIKSINLINNTSKIYTLKTKTAPIMYGNGIYM